MYITPERRRPLAIPQNYSGNLFSEPEQEPVQESEPEAAPVVACQKKDVFSNSFDSEELLLLGLLILLSQDGFGDDIIPILLIILFFKK